MLYYKLVEKLTNASFFLTKSLEISWKNIEDMVRFGKNSSFLEEAIPITYYHRDFFRQAKLFAL